MSNYDYTEEGEGPDKIKIGVLKPKSELNPFPSPKIDRPDYNFSVTELLSGLKSSQPRISPRRFRKN